MISEIRKYIKETFKADCPRYREIEDPFFEDENLQGTKVESSYTLEIGQTTSNIGDRLGNVDEIPVTLKMYVQGTRDKLKDFDEGFSNALLIKALIVDSPQLLSQDIIKGITSSGVTPSLVINSENIYKFEISFIFTISYGLGE